MKPILTSHDGQCQYGLSRMGTYDQPHASPELYDCATGTDSGLVVKRFLCVLEHPCEL